MKRYLSMLLVMAALLVQGPHAQAAEVTLMLDWFPNVDHLPIYVAKEKGYFSAENLQVEIVSPSDTADALTLAVTGKVGGRPSPRDCVVRQSLVPTRFLAFPSF